MTFQEFLDMNKSKYASMFGFPIPESKTLELAETDFDLLAERQRNRRGPKQPRIGDVVRYEDGTLDQIVVSYDDAIQVYGVDRGSFFVYQSGSMEHSGSCGDLIKKDRLVRTEDEHAVNVWIFSQNRSGAGRGVYGKMDVTVWDVKPED